MKKITIGFILAVALVVSSCVGSPVVFDESVPLEQSATIYFEGFEVNSYNGIEVPTRNLYPPGSIKSSWNYITIPAGEIEFGGMASHVTRDTFFYSGTDLFFKYKFEPGEYCIYGTYFHENYMGKWGVYIYSGKAPSLGQPPKDRLITYIPIYSK